MGLLCAHLLPSLREERSKRLLNHCCFSQTVPSAVPPKTIIDFGGQTSSCSIEVRFLRDPPAVAGLLVLGGVDAIDLKTVFEPMPFGPPSERCERLPCLTDLDALPAVPAI